MLIQRVVQKELVRNEAIIYQYEKAYRRIAKRLFDLQEKGLL